MSFHRLDRRSGLPNNCLQNSADIPDFHPRFHLNNDAGKLSRLMVATRKSRNRICSKITSGTQRPSRISPVKGLSCWMREVIRYVWSRGRTYSSFFSRTHQRSQIILADWKIGRSGHVRAGGRTCPAKACSTQSGRTNLSGF
jgi:hypothetical protein